MPFDYGKAPTIAVINKAVTTIGFTLGDTVTALQQQLDRDFFPIWGKRADLTILDPSADTTPGVWQLLIVDKAQEPGAEGYHDLTVDGFPIMYIGVQDTLSAGDTVPVTISHEILEGLIDPAINAVVEAPDGTEYAAENCDAVEEDTYQIGVIPVSNFQTPAWFMGNLKTGQASFDFMNLCKNPFEIRKGGYMSIKKRGRWTQVFGSKESKIQHAKRARRRFQLRKMGGRFHTVAHRNGAKIFHQDRFKSYVY